jgi:hypothetical protein
VAGWRRPPRRRCRSRAPTVGQAETQGLEVGPIQQGLLVDEAPGDDQQVVIDDVELVQQG